MFRHGSHWLPAAKLEGGKSWAPCRRPGSASPCVAATLSLFLAPGSSSLLPTTSRSLLGDQTLEAELDGHRLAACQLPMPRNQVDGKGWTKVGTWSLSLAQWSFPASLSSSGVLNLTWIITWVVAIIILTYEKRTLGPWKGVGSFGIKEVIGNGLCNSEQSVLIIYASVGTGNGPDVFFLLFSPSLTLGYPPPPSCLPPRMPLAHTPTLTPSLSVHQALQLAQMPVLEPQRLPLERMVGA